MFLFVILPFDSAQRERAVLPYLGCRGMSSLKGYSFFKDILVRNRVSILVILVSNWVWFLHSSLELFAMFLYLSLVTVVDDVSQVVVHEP